MSLHDIIYRVAQGDTPGHGDVAILDAVLARHPWFTTARVLRQVASGEEDPMLDLHLHSWPRPRVMLVGGGTDGRADTKKPDDAIDRFLAHGDYKIVPGEGVGEDNAAAASEYFDIEDGMLTEELALIYLSQGLRDEARKIYERLSLQNPEKSVYFARLIAQCKGEN